MDKAKNPRQLNKKMLERLIIIHNAIKSEQYPNNQGLQRIYCQKTGYSKVGEATINRDIDTLRTYFYAPLEFDRQKGGYYYSNQDFDIPLNRISQTDVLYLSAAKTMVSSFKGSPLYAAISEVIDFIIDTQGVGKSSLLQRIALPPVPKVLTGEDVWEKVLDSLQKNLIIEFDYTGRWNTEKTHRRIEPYQILLDDGQCFLFGYDHIRKAERIFSLSQMKNLIVTTETFSLPEDFEFSSRCGGSYFGTFMADEPVDFVIEFYNDACEYVKSRIWAENQKLEEFKDENKVRISFTSAQVLKITEWILAQGENALPISPQWFVDEWKERIVAMTKRAGLN